MSFTELTEAFLRRAAGREAVESARLLLADGNVLSSNWTPHLLKGVVREGEASFRAGLVIKGPLDIDNLCTCRAAREAGVICAHSVAIGLHHLHRSKAPARGGDTATRLPAGLGRVRPVVEPEPEAGPRLRRGAKGEALEIFVVLPVTFTAALERGKVMVGFEGK